MISAKAKTKFDKKGLKRRVDDANFRSLGHASAAIRLTAKRSIRKRKKPSMPGSAPHTPTGHLRRVITYAVDRKRQEAAIGPTNEHARTIWNLHEFGGTRKRPRDDRFDSFYKVGDYGPMRKGLLVRRRLASGSMTTYRYQNKYQRILLRTAAQAARANRIQEQINAEKRAKESPIQRYPERPFMGPALAKMRKRIPKFWKDSVRN